MRQNRSHALAAVLLLPFLWLGCGGSNSSNKDTTVTVSPTSPSIVVGKTVQLTATASSGSTQVTWHSDAGDIATVSSTGLVTGVQAGAARIVATIDGATGSQLVTVTNVATTDGGAGSDMTPAIPAPELTGIAPQRGVVAGGTSVVLTGVNLDGATAVSFGSTAAASFTVDSATQITAVSPAGTGGVDVTVATAGGTSNAVPFGYGAAPMITSATPNVGVAAGGTTVTLAGSGLTGVNTITFGTTAATSFSIDSDTQITVDAPPHAGGAVQIVATSIIAASNGVTFTYVDTPSITGLSPVTGPVAGGTSVTITGENLAGTTSVTFGGIAGTGLTLDPDGSVTVTTPAALLPGSATVVLTTPFGAASSTFTYDALPVVSALGTTSGPPAGGTVVAITGANFVSGATVKFGTVAATDVHFNSATSITATSPAGTGTVDVTVTTPGGTSATGAVDQFTYVSPGTITMVFSNAGPPYPSTSVNGTGLAWLGTTATSYLVFHPATAPAPGASIIGDPSFVPSTASDGQQLRIGVDVPTGTNVFICAATATVYDTSLCTNVFPH